ncbi:Ubiquitin carboxyl-terminal hydrolase 8-like 7 [Homarus americanus]|uniref:Ubiquitin carboxyl-terminal hydrolase n=1 Tax=Homarus americanus TaxID=6706 RepID=A0A8J5MTU9_HOMAM|nr:Ubiquitin carboxyl-terminal hydrolase 8-like 7 [Homarus americanus]
MEGRDECNVTIVDSTSTITTTTTMVPTTTETITSAETTSATTISSAMTLTTREMTTVQAPQLPPTPTGAPTPPPPSTTPPPTPIGAPTPTPPPPPTTTPPPPTTTPSPATTTTTTPPPSPTTPPPTTPPPPSTTPTTTTTTPPPSPSTTPPPPSTTTPPPSTTPSPTTTPPPPTEPVTGTELPPTAKLQTPLTETQITAPSNVYPTESTELDTSTEMQKLPTEDAEMMDIDEEPLWKDAEIKKLTRQVKNQQREMERMKEAYLEENKFRRSCEKRIRDLEVELNATKTDNNSIRKMEQYYMEEIPPNVQKIRSVSANSSWGEPRSTSHSAGSRAYDAMLPSGLKNIGNTCYINSVLQCLFNVYDFSYHFIYMGYKQDLNRENKLNAEVVDVIAQIFQALHNKTPTDTYLRKFKDVLCKCDEQFVGSGQQDAHDLLTVVLTCLHEALTTVQDPANDSSISIVSDIFHGLQESTIVCPKTGSVISRTRETFNSISLPVDMLKDWSLEELIKKHFEDQRIEWECVDCGTLHPCNHTTILVTLPIILIIHLSKIANYNLVGVCHHRGTANAGHYFALCKKWDDNNWYLYDDSYVSQLRSQHHAPDTAHILFYKAMTESYPTQIPHTNSS